MNLTIVANKLDLEAGGSNFSLDLMARSLGGRGHDVTVVTTNVTAPNSYRDVQNYTVVEHSVEKHELLSPERVAEPFERFEAETDVYQVFSPLLAPYAGYYRENGGEAPVLGRLNQYRSLCSDVSRMDGTCHESCGFAQLLAHSTAEIPDRLARLPFYYLQSRRYVQWMQSVDRYYAISPAVKDVFAGFGVDEALVDVVPNFFDPAFTEPPVDGAEPCRNLLYVGRLSEEKGVDVLVRALSDVRSTVGLDVVGDGPHREKLARLVADRSLEGRVTFHGRVDHGELGRYYREADVFVHPGRWPEPFGRTILEAWQHNCAVVVSDVGGPPWVIKDAGLLFERNDVEGLASQIERCAADPERVAALQRKGRRRLQRFDPETVLDTVEGRLRAIAGRSEEPTHGD